MSISSLGATNSIFTNTATSSLTPAGSNAGGVDADGDHDGSGPASSTRVSGFAQFLSTLQTLEQTNPSLASETLTKLADQVRSQAQTAGSDSAGLAQFADKLSQAAQTGDLSGLKPSGGGHHGHHGHHHHADGGASSASSSEPNPYAQGSAPPTTSSLLDLLNTTLQQVQASVATSTSTSAALPTSSSGSTGSTG